MAKILLVDDEEPLLRLMKLYLERGGHKALTASDGAQCLQALSEDPAIDLLVLDMSLPDIDGEPVSTRVLTRFPTLSVLIASGAPVDAAQLPLSGRKIAFLRKPFRPTEFSQAVEALLESESAGPAAQ